MNKAFTVVEMLLVIIILSIVAAIVIPQFTEHQDNSPPTSAPATQSTEK